MRYRQLGSSDLNVSAISLGSWKTYGGGGISDEQARSCIDTAFACGIKLIDTANVYSRLRPIADRLGLTIAQLALAWILREANVAAAIVGASWPEQVRENAAAADIDLDDETIADVEAIFS